MLTPTLRTFLCAAVLALSLSHTGLASAHAVVTESTLKEKTLPANTPRQVELFFNSAVELSLSRIFLVSKGDKQDRLDAVAGSKPGQIIISLPPLIPGEYALRYKIFAADGHLTEDIIHFNVIQ